MGTFQTSDALSLPFHPFTLYIAPNKIGSEVRINELPEAILVAKNFQKSVLGLYLGNRFLMVSLNAKLKACVGK